jgi:hypothetical protein
MLKKRLLQLTIFLLALMVTVPTVVAQSADSEASESTKSDTDNINELIKKKASESKVKGISSDHKRGFIATVKRVSEEALTVETRKGTEIITLSDVVSILQDNKPFEVENIEIDSHLVIMGYQDGEDFSARRILVLKSPLQPTPKTIWVGSIKEIGKTIGNGVFPFSIMTRGTSEDRTFSLTNKTIIQDENGTTLKTSDLETDQEVILITVEEDTNSRAVKDSSGRIIRVHSLVPADATPASSTKSSPTATPRAGSATRSPTATPEE